MTTVALADLQASIQDKAAFGRLSDYLTIGRAFLGYLEESQPTCIVSPTQSNYIFYQYGEGQGHRITRPLNTNLFIATPAGLEEAFSRFADFLADLRKWQEAAARRRKSGQILRSGEINKVVYTVQQAIGCIGDSFDNPNQARKRVGQLFENLVKLILQEVGMECEPRTITIPIPGYPGYEMSYELDLVFSRGKAIIASETQFIHPSEVVGAIKTTSKDRLDKVFLDKYLLTHLLDRNVPVVAIFLHDVQRAQRGNSIFGVSSTFKSNHFLGYTVALTRLDGVYYVDPRPEMSTDARLREQIHDFQQFLVKDMWALSSATR